MIYIIAIAAVVGILFLGMPIIMSLIPASMDPGSASLLLYYLFQLKAIVIVFAIARWWFGNTTLGWLGALTSAAFAAAVIFLFNQTHSGLKLQQAAAAPPGAAGKTGRSVWQSVLIVPCSPDEKSWSKPVETPTTGATIDWTWRVDTQYLFEGQWLRHEPKSNVSADAFRYCHDGHLVNKQMTVYLIH